MTLPNIRQVKQSPSTTWRKTQKPGAKPYWINVCAKFLPPCKLSTSKPGIWPSKYKGLRRVIFSYVLTDDAWPYPHATDPSLKEILYAI